MIKAHTFNARRAFVTLIRKEIARFRCAAFHTIAAPVLSSLLYLIVFGAALKERVKLDAGVDYVAFLVPGLVMMAVLQNAFANTSSSFVQSKISGTLHFILVPPMSGCLIASAYVLAATLRGLLVGACVLIATLFWAPVSLASCGWILAFGTFGALLMATLGLIGGLWAEKYEQMGMIQTFVVMPLTFLSGVFYSTDALPEPWREFTLFNPVFYLIDGFRGGFLGRFESDPFASLVVVAIATAGLFAVAVKLLSCGYKIKS